MKGRRSFGGSWRRSSPRVTTRLLGVVLVPVTVMCVLAGSVVVSHRQASTQAEAVHEGAGELSQLVALRGALYVERSAEWFNGRFDDFGVSREVATEAMGFDWSTAVTPARATAADAVASLGSSAPMSASALRQLHADVDLLRIVPEQAAQRLDGAIELVNRALTRHVDALQGEASDGDLTAALESVRAVSQLVESAAPQGMDLTLLWFPPAAATPQSTAAALAGFGARSATYANALHRLREVGSPAAVAVLDRMAADPGVQAFGAGVERTLEGGVLPAPGELTPEVISNEAFRGFVARSTYLDRVVASTTRAVHVQAEALADFEGRSFVVWSLGTLVLAMASITVALRLAHSISRPLTSLAVYANRVNDGDLDAPMPTSATRGPQETRVAFDAFTDLVANLQLLDAKASALALCDFDDPALAEVLPGRLGRSLQSSVELLSGSIVERDRLQSRLVHQATHDALTGLGNRPAAISAIEAAFERSARTGTMTAALFLDLNDFKIVNDSYGHEGGDEVLRQVARNLQRALRPYDFLARLGGDEFVVVAEALAGAPDASRLAHRMLEAVALPIHVSGAEVHVGGAIGIALSLDGPEEPLRLLARADAAMYRAKERGTSGVEIYDATLQREMSEREEVEADLRVALVDPDGGLRLHYQPVIDAVTGELVSVEALIRWERAGHGLVAPDQFIPIAESTALILDVDRWVLAEATRQLAAWADDPALSGLTVAVNISGRHLLSRHLPGDIAAALDRAGVEARQLTIEITETVLLTDLVVAAAELDAVRAFGVKVAIDDFGTGYSSLAHLQHLPVDILKVDRSFVTQLNEQRGCSVVQMISDLGHAIGMRIIAEGVETNEELRALQDIGVDELQGFLLSRPLEAQVLAHWAQRRFEMAELPVRRPDAWRVPRPVSEAPASAPRHRRASSRHRRSDS